jgi:hypothetical protein
VATTTFKKSQKLTTPENHRLTYAFEKLEELDILTVSKPEKTVERMVEEQKRIFQYSKQAELTEKGGST